jgi:hypothetical protein
LGWTISVSYHSTVTSLSRAGQTLAAILLTVVLLWGAPFPVTKEIRATDPSGTSVQPFRTSAKARVFVFVRTDCPITNRYAPELQRIAARFHDKGVEFWLVYPDRSETAAEIRKHIKSYGFPGQPLRDPGHELESITQVTVAPEAAVFDETGQLRYHGRIDDCWVTFGTSRPSATRHDLEEAITAVVAGKVVSVPVTHAIGCYLADLR